MELDAGLSIATANDSRRFESAIQTMADSVFYDGRSRRDAMMRDAVRPTDAITLAKANSAAARLTMVGPVGVSNQ